MAAAAEQGQHITFDGISQRILNRLDLEAFLTRCPQVIGMTIISGPHLARTESGLAGIVVIADSHISVHTIGLVVYGDIFSCRAFERDRAMKLAEQLLQLEGGSRVQTLRRGWGK